MTSLLPMAGTTVQAGLGRKNSMRRQGLQWKFHPQRDLLLAEAHARPSTPVQAPHLASRIATMSGEGGVGADRAHMAALCRKIGTSEPGPDARWCVVDGGTWRLRWERHTEISTWTVFRDSPTTPDFTFCHKTGWPTCPGRFWARPMSCCPHWHPTICPLPIVTLSRHGSQTARLMSSVTFAQVLIPSRALSWCSLTQIR